jgi:hypothetical protein
MSMSMPTLDVCTLSNIRVAFNTHCFVQIEPHPREACPGRPAQIVSRLRPGVELAEHFVNGVDDRLRLIQLNLVT